MKLRTKLLVSVSTTVIAALTSISANASIEEQFNTCAEEAIASQKISAKKISIELPTASKASMDHDESFATYEYVMELVNPKTGMALGKVSCTLTKDGNVRSVRYLSKR